MHENSPLFQLPFEVRERIYGFYLSFEYTDFNDTLRPGLTYFESDACYSTPLPALMLACKALYRELAPAVHEQAFLRIHKLGQYSDRRIGFAVRGTLRFARLRTLYLLVAMEYPNWNGWLAFFGEVVRHARNLTTLVVDWRPRPVRDGAWYGRMNRKKEDELLRIIAGAESLQTIRLYGGVPAGWKDYFEANSGIRVVDYPFPWWVEPGLS
ncbi:hypothetical protein F5X99DRAFT_215889 [Biscogniauxia marginata]|nr:hypothetical protein F5X99DRAFT_215889 [Biscogniauxia marginata]